MSPAQKESRFPVGLVQAVGRSLSLHWHDYAADYAERDGNSKGSSSNKSESIASSTKLAQSHAELNLQGYSNWKRLNELPTLVSLALRVTGNH
jgi:hypothetical protein